MLRLDDIGIQFGGTFLFRNLSWQLKSTDRVGLIGPNGIGKTTLMRIVAGDQSSDEGKTSRPNDCVIGYLSQEIPPPTNKTVGDEIRDTFKEVRAIERELPELEKQLAGLDPESREFRTAMQRYGTLQHEYIRLDGFSLDAKIGAVLEGLGFRSGDVNRRLRELSGGWRVRVNLAKILLSKPDYLFLDEPTNHLDIESLQWLEDHLRSLEGGLVLISHDRRFLQKLASKIVELDHSGLTEYPGDYDQYLKEKTRRLEVLKTTKKRQDEKVARIQRFVDKWRSDKRRARQAQSRKRILSKIKRIELPPEHRRVRFQFPEAPREGRVALELRNVRKSFGDNRVIRGADLKIERGERIAIVGPNGRGKSTIIRILAGITDFEGERLEGHQLITGYFAQEQTESLNMNNTVLEEMMECVPNELAPRVRTMLGSFLFSGKDVHKSIGVLSGGEKTRLALCKMLTQPANLLLMDEPTNNLDIASKEILEEAIADFPGAVAIVSHDRYTMDKLVNRVIEIEDGKLHSYSGNYSDYAEKKRRLQDEEKAEETTGRDDKKQLKKPKEQRRREAEERNRRNRIIRARQTAINRLERQIGELEARKKEVETLLACPTVYGDRNRAGELHKRFQRYEDKLARLYEQWEELSEVDLINNHQDNNDAK